MVEVYAFDLMPWPYLEQPSFYPDPNAGFDPARGRMLYEEHLSQMELYETCGFDAICLNEHHAKPYGLMPSPNLMAAALAQRTKRVRIGIYGNVTPLHDPIRLAEELAMLDLLTGGRLMAGFVRGVPQEYLAMNVPLQESRPRHEEAIELILRAWTEREPFEWRGKFYPHERVSIWPRPLQAPYPSVVLPAESREGAEFAARLRAATGVAFRSTLRCKGVLDLYRCAAARHGWTPRAVDCQVMRFVYVAESSAKAREEAAPHLDYFWRRLITNQSGALRFLPASGAAPTPGSRPVTEYDLDFTQAEGITIVGDPSFVSESILSQTEELGVGVLIGMFTFGSLPPELARKNITLFAERVLPAIR
jgi:alkanesulfonate monooxygenase SsuD/methylene tetrahydromethanopterin reductase-like flavin-dependent oxidoreductase (luciferase family)